MRDTALVQAMGVLRTSYAVRRHGSVEMKITLTPTTEVPVVVWCNEGMFYARQSDTVTEPQICLAVDLFEVIAELAGLDLEDASQSAEAVALADRAQRELD
jgi:hypothetical protein